MENERTETDGPESSSTSEHQANFNSSIQNPIDALPPAYQLIDRAEEIVQVVYQSNPNGSLVGVETSLISGTQSPTEVGHISGYGANCVTPTTAGTMAVASGGPNLVTRTTNQPTALNSLAQQTARVVATTLPSVAEESSSSGHATGGQSTNLISLNIAQEFPVVDASEVESTTTTNVGVVAQVDPNLEVSLADRATTGASAATIKTTAVAPAAPATTMATNDLNAGDPIYSTINRRATGASKKVDAGIFSPSSALSTATDDSKSTKLDEPNQENQAPENVEPANPVEGIVEEESKEKNELGADATADTDIDDNGSSSLMWRQKQGAAESGSFRRNHHKKKLGVSVSTNENDLITHRQKFLEANESNTSETSAEKQMKDESSDSHLSISKFKRTHSVSFNVNSSRSNRHSVDIRNLPSYLTHKRASIVDVARGAMSSLISSFGGSGNASVISGSHRRDSSPEEEPIFEEPIAPTLSLGQRVALVRESGAEFGTVGWIGQLPGIDDDWIVGVIFDNMIGNCDGAYNGVRYFYAQENYAMFVPLSLLTKTDNYIGRPETGTMLSRMSVQLKPGQLISIQRSSIRLQHCFLNAPHQRVGHDVRAVSNRLHCQCHNCGPCAHLTKQGRPFVLPHFGSHHIPHKSKNSLARAAVELLAHHHHHHFHDEEEHHENEEDCHFGDNSAHACNYVRYSCCKQNGVGGHEFLNDCEMVRPELLDNLIHAPKAPHRRSQSRRRRSRKDYSSRNIDRIQYTQRDMIGAPEDYNTADSNQSTLDKAYIGQNQQLAIDGSAFMSVPQPAIEGASSSGMSRSASPERTNYTNDGVYQYDSTMSYKTTGVYNTIDSQVSMMDQQRFIYQRDSSAAIGQQQRFECNEDEASEASGVGFGKRILKCLGCLRHRNRTTRRRKGRSKGRRLSARDRMIEYRRRQSTFVPSTLAKPHEDFASHGIIFPPEGGNIADGGNSDYSSYSRSSCSSSRSSSPGSADDRCGIDYPTKVDMDQLAANMDEQLQTTLTLEHGKQSQSNDLLKSCSNVDTRTAEHSEQPLINYGDYVSNSSYGSFKKSLSNQQSDLGFSETCTNYSSDTLKNLVDHSINQEVSQPEPIVAGGPNEHLLVSPIPSANGSSLSDELIDISSPTESSERCEDDAGHLQDEEDEEEEEDSASELNPNEP